MEKRSKKIGLVLPGGGVRGYCTALMLEHLQNVLMQQRLKDQIDIVSGTSTGSIIGAQLVMGKEPINIRKRYQKFANEAFPRQRNILRRLFNTKYSASNLKRLLKDNLPDKKFKDVDFNFAVFSAELENSYPAVFKTWKEQSDVSLHDVVLTSTAAPTYFPQHKGYVDGGVWANMPIMETYTLMEELWPMADKTIIVVGTGYKYPSLKRRGDLRYWAKNVVPFKMALQEQSSKWIAEKTGDLQFIELDFELSRVYDMDDGSLETLRELRSETLEFITKNLERFEDAVEVLEWWKEKS